MHIDTTIKRTHPSTAICFTNLNSLDNSSVTITYTGYSIPWSNYNNSGTQKTLNGFHSNTQVTLINDFRWLLSERMQIIVYNYQIHVALLILTQRKIRNKSEPTVDTTVASVLRSLLEKKSRITNLHLQKVIHVVTLCRISLLFAIICLCARLSKWIPAHLAFKISHKITL